MKNEYSTKIMGSKGMNDKEIKEYYKRLKDLRNVINRDNDGKSASEKIFELSGGLRFYYQEWVPNMKTHGKIPKKIVIVLHHAYGCSDLFYPLADSLTKHGTMVVGIDYRGHGRTGGQAGGHIGDITNFDEVLQDITKLITFYEEQFNLPLFLVGYDLGALLALKIAHNHPPKNLEGLILISPLIQLKNRLKHMVLYPAIKVGQVFSKANTVQPVIPEKLESTYFSEYQEFAKHDPFRLAEMSLRLFKGILQLINHTKRFAKKINYPCLILQGTKDHVVDAFGVHNFYNKWGHPNKLIRLYENAGHNLLMDKYTQEIYAEMGKFIENI